MITRNGVCYDFNVSPYRHKVGDLTFVFSSQLHLEKFASKLDENRAKINGSLTSRFGFSVDVPALADVVLYRKIETRGFLIVTHEGFEIWQKDKVKYVGATAIMPSFNE